MRVIYKPTGQLGDIPDDKFNPLLFSSAGQPSPSPAPSNAPTIQQAPQQDFATNIGNGLGNILFGASKPFRQAAQGVGDLGASGMYLIDKYLLKDPSADNKLINTQLPFLNAQENQQAQANPLKTGVQSALGMASYAVPFGKGANLLTKVLLPGAGVGALQGASEDNATAASIAGNAILGAGGAGALHAVSPVLSKILGGVGGGLDNAATDIIKNQYAGPKGVADANQLGNTISKLKKYGINSFNDITKIAPQVTGDTGVITQLTRDAVSKSKSIDTGGMLRIGKDLIAGEPVIGRAAGKRFNDLLAKGINAIGGGSGDEAGLGSFAKGSKPFDIKYSENFTPESSSGNTLFTRRGGVKPGVKGPPGYLGEVSKNTQGAWYQGPLRDWTMGIRDNQFGQGELNVSNSNPTKTYDFIKKLEDSAATYRHSASDEGRALARVYQGVANELTDRLYQKAGADKVLTESSITPQILDKIKQISPQLAQEVSQVKTVGQLRSLAAPFVRGSKLVKATENAKSNELPGDILAAGGLGALQAVASGILGPQALLAAGAGYLGKKAIASDTGQAVLSKILSGSGAGAKSTASAVSAIGGNPIMQYLAGQGGARAGVALGQPGASPDQLNNSNNSTAQQTKNNSLNQVNPPPSGNNISQDVNITPEMVKEAQLYLPKYQAEKIAAAYKAQFAAGAPPSDSDKANSDAGLRDFAKVSSILKTDPNIILKKSIPGAYGAQEYKAAETDMLNAYIYLKTGKQASDAERNSYSYLLPRIGDPQSALDAKLQIFSDYFNQRAKGQ